MHRNCAHWKTIQTSDPSAYSSTLVRKKLIDLKWAKKGNQTEKKKRY